MKIVVLAKQVPDTWSERKLDLETGSLDRSASEPVPDEINERAMDVALRIKEQNSETEIIALTMGLEDSTQTLRKLLALGADSAILVSDPTLAGSDMVQTARVLAVAAEKTGADLLIAGNEATDGRGGMVPAMVAELLGWAILPSLDEVQVRADSVSGSTQIDGGTLELSSSFPAVISVTEKAGEARFPNFKGIMQAKKKPLETLNLGDLGIHAGPESASVRSVMVSATARPEKVAGPKIEDDGTAAAQLTDFLVANRLI